MITTQSTTTVTTTFFQPLHGLAAASPQARPCPEFADEQFVRLGVQRVLESSESGRAFLQEHDVRFDDTPGNANYFAALQSPRRVAVLRDVNLGLVAAVDSMGHDRLGEIAELTQYECFALDGHWHKAAAHDARPKGVKMVVGHFYSLNLRTHTLRHLTAGEGLHEHDLSALKRVKPKGLRQEVPQGRRVLCIYDKAGINLGYWQRCRQECAVYFLSRLKENMVFDWLETIAWDRTDERNHGVTNDRRVMFEGGHKLRIVSYTDPRSGESYEFLTNEMDLPPGVIAELYRRRWEAEKVFDEIKNKLNERKAWATSLTAKTAQAQFIALTHNLLVLYEQVLETEHGVINQAEDQRRAKRTQAEEQAYLQAGQPLSALVLMTRRATQRSVKFIRWIRQSIRDNVAEAIAVSRLKALYAVL